MHVLPMIHPAPAPAAGANSGSTSLDSADASFVALLAEALTEWMADDPGSSDAEGTDLDDDTVAAEAAVATEADPAPNQIALIIATAWSLGGVAPTAEVDPQPTEGAAGDVEVEGVETVEQPSATTEDPTSDERVDDAGKGLRGVETASVPAVSVEADAVAGEDPMAAIGATAAAATSVASHGSADEDGSPDPVADAESRASVQRSDAATPVTSNGTPSSNVATDAPTAAPAPPQSVAEAMFEADLAALEAEDPWQQLATVVRPLRLGSDGTHRISLQLRPAELGTVHLEVALEDGRLSMRAVAETIATRDVILNSLPDLRAELTKAGITLGDLDVGEQTTDGSGAEQPRTSPTQVSASATVGAGADIVTPSESSTPTTAAPGSGRLDLSL